MAKATIKSKTGSLITIEGTDQEVANVLRQFETVASVSDSKEVVRKEVSQKGEHKKRSGAADSIVELEEIGFFDKPKTLVEVAHALEEKAHLYPITTLSGVMIGLVQKRLLGRKKVDGKWVYGK